MKLLTKPPEGSSGGAPGDRPGASLAGVSLAPLWRLSSSWLGLELARGERALLFSKRGQKKSPALSVPPVCRRGKPRARGLIQQGCAARDAATSHLCRGTAAKAKNLSEEDVVEEGVAAGPELRHSRGELPFTPEELVVAAQHGPRRRRG